MSFAEQENFEEEKKLCIVRKYLYDYYREKCKNIKKSHNFVAVVNKTRHSKLSNTNTVINQKNTSVRPDSLCFSVKYKDNYTTEDRGWINWNIDNNVGSSISNYYYTIDPSYTDMYSTKINMKNILIITTEKDVYDFEKKYGKGNKGNRFIKWEVLEKEYFGVYFSKYFEKLSSDMYWYSTIGAVTLFLWNPICIEEIIKL